MPRPCLQYARSLAWVFGLAALTAHAEAPDPASDETTMEAVVVTGTRTEKTITEVPIRTEVVTRKELERTHARTLTEALKDVPGLQLRPVHGKSGYEVSLQGMTGEQVLILVDGLPISASTGSTVDVSQLAQVDVDHIEIVKGATSAQYGSSAMGGVINVITRPIQPGFSGELQADAGSYGAQNPSEKDYEPGNIHGRGRIDGGNQEWRLRLSADKRNNDGFDPDSDSWPQPGDQVDREQADARVEWHPSDQGFLFLQGGGFREDGESRFQLQLPGQAVDQSKQEEAERTRINAGGNWRWSNGVSAKLNAVNEDFTDNTLMFASGTSFDDRRANLGLTHVTSQIDLPMWGPHLLQFGADYHRETLQQTKDGNTELDSQDEVERDSKELFVQDDILSGDIWEFLLGVRAQDDSDFGEHTAPKLSARGNLLDRDAVKGAVRVSWGQGYRVPNLKERHFRFDHSELGYVVIGNPDLQPEESSSWQLGWTMNWRDAVNLDLNLFHNKLHNLIQVDEANAVVVNGITQFRYENVARARTQGAELAMTWQVLPRVGVTSGYTFLDTKDETSGTRLTQQPRHQARFGIDWQVFDHTSLNLRSRYQSNELVSSVTGAKSPSWAVADLTASHDLTPALRLLGGVNNIFNKQRDFTDPNDFGPLEGTFVYLGMQYAWGKELKSPTQPL